MPNTPYEGIYLRAIECSWTCEYLNLGYGKLIVVGVIMWNNSQD